MVKVLLSCDADDFDVALSLKSLIQEELGYKVFLDVDDWKQQEDENQSLAFASDFDDKLEGAAVLLVSNSVNRASRLGSC